MKCKLSIEQQTAAAAVVKKLIVKNAWDSSEELLKKVYDIFYDEFLKRGMPQDEAQTFSVAIVAYVAEPLHQLAVSEKEGDYLHKIGLDLNLKGTENAIKYTNVEEVKKLVGINNTSGIKRVLSTLTKEEEKQVETHLKKIGESFSSVTTEMDLTKKNGFPNRPEIIKVKTVDGKPLFHVSTFSKNKIPETFTQQGFNVALSYGNMVDYSLRYIFKSKGINFKDIKNSLRKDSYLISTFSSYSLGKSQPEADPTSSNNFNAYFDKFLDDVIIMASRFETEYKGYHITDLTSILETSRISKEAFYIYSSQLGLIGELDFIAIKPDGTFKVIDVKTGKDELLNLVSEDYLKQISAYTHIIAEATGLKPESNGDIFYIENSYRANKNEIAADPNNRRKAVLTGINIVSKPILTIEQLQEEIKKYQDKVFRQYSVAENSKVTPVDLKNKPVKRLKINSLIKASLERIKQDEKNKEGLNQTIVEGESLSTRESIKQQAEWLQKVFPELTLGESLRIVPVLASNVGGKFFEDAIILAEKSNEGVGYHEGWHRFSQLYLTKDEKTNLYGGLNGKNIKFKNREGIELNTQTASNIELEEFLAEEFRKYAANPKTYSFPTEEVKGFFGQILKIIKAFLKFVKLNGENSYIRLFEQLYDGNFYKGNYSKSNVMFGSLNSFFKDTKNEGRQVLTDREFLKFVNITDSALSSHFFETGTLLQEYLSVDGIDGLSLIIHEKLKTLRNGVIKLLEQDIDDLRVQNLLSQFNKILGESPETSNISSFIKAYLKTTNFSTLRTYVGANIDLVNKIVEENIKNNSEEGNEVDEERKSVETEENKGKEQQYDRAGNEVPADELMSDVVKDFFNGIPELTVQGLIPLEDDGSIDFENYQRFDDEGLPVFLDKRAAYYKTLNILKGRFTWDLIRDAVFNSDNYIQFPELQFLRERLFGENGIYTRLTSIQDVIKSGEYSEEKLPSLLAEQRRILSFLSQFKHSVTLPSVRFESFVVNTSSIKTETDRNTRATPVLTRENTETILSHIINTFSNGFQNNARKKQERNIQNGLPAFMDVYDAMHILMNNGNLEALAKQEFLYDSVSKQFHFNPFYITNQQRFSVDGMDYSSVTLKEIQEFLRIYGIDIDQRAFDKAEELERSGGKSPLRNQFGAFKKLADAQSKDSHAVALSVLKSEYRLAKIDKLKELENTAIRLSEEPEINRNSLITVQNEIIQLRKELKTIASKIFPTRPVDNLMYRNEEGIAQDKDAEKQDYQKYFALSLPTFISLARIQKDYVDTFSSGSMLVGEETQFSYYLPNQMLLVSNLLELDVQSFDDFDKHYELYHLNPKRNPYLKNSWIFGQLFDFNTGKRRPEFSMTISNLSQLVLKNDSGQTVKKLSELTMDEKFIVDFLLLNTEGSTEIRRMETSNTAYRLAVVKDINGQHKFVKPPELGRMQFNDPRFQGQIRGYIQSSIFKYVYDITNEKNEKLKKNASLSIFEDMLGKELSQEIKDRVHSILKKDKNYDFNNFFKDLNVGKSIEHVAENSTEKYIGSVTYEGKDGEFLSKIEAAIVKYFDGVSITNPDSVLNEVMPAMSEKTQGIIMDLLKNYFGNTDGGNIIRAKQNFSRFSDLVQDEKFHLMIKNMIAADFIMAMEDSILLFGDYSYYSDPIKRRKIIGNNGHIGIVDVLEAEILKTQVEKNGMISAYRSAKGLPEETGKDFRLVRKSVIKDLKIASSKLGSKNNKAIMKLADDYTSGNIKESEYISSIAPLIKDSQLMQEFREFYNEYQEENLTDEEIIKKKLNVIIGFSNMKIADGGAYVSLDLYKRLRDMADEWHENDEAEFKRQKLILKHEILREEGKLNIEDAQIIEELSYISNGPYSEFNVAKFALTGPVFSKETAPLKPTFDKMGLKPLLPSSDWKTKRALFEYMLSESVDYAVYDSASKGYMRESHEVWNEDFTQKKNPNLSYDEHAGGFMKLQQNTSAVKDKSNFAVQLRGTFHSLMILDAAKNGGKVSPELKKLYDNFLSTLTEYTQFLGSKELAKLGIDKEGNFVKDEEGYPVGKKMFIEKIREKLLQLGNVDIALLEHLDLNTDGSFKVFLEALPLNRDIYNIVSGILDDGFRKIKMNGSKMYQTMELGSTVKRKLKEGTLDLKWHGLIKDLSGKIIAVSPVECKIAFKKNFHPLLQLKDLEGNKIKTLDKLNRLLRNKEWVENNKESITMVGIRIPLQDLNFTSHLIIKEFLPEEEGDTIIVPPEFYQQVGADNDIDTITTTFKYLDKRTGEPIIKPTESYQSILKEIKKLEDKIFESTEEVVYHSYKDEFAEEQLNEIRNRFIEQNVYANRGRNESELFDDLSIVEDGNGIKYIKGLDNRKSFLYKLYKESFKNNTHTDLLDELFELEQNLNDVVYQSDLNEDEISNLKKELRGWKRKRNNYLKGLNNDILNPMISYLSKPESFEYLTDTDTILPVENLAKEVISMITGEPIENITLNDNEVKSLLRQFGYRDNLINHKNNFQLRSMLGSFVKTSRLFTTLLQLGTKINTTYKSSSIANLVNDKKKGSKIYERLIYTPLLSKKKTENGVIELSPFDEDGARINKNISMIVSSLLDLFKNIETFPSLGISWNNIKPLLFLTIQGVPMNRAVKFLNNPISTMIEETSVKLGKDFFLKHAIVQTSWDLFGNSMHKPEEFNRFKTIDGKGDIGLKRPYLPAQEYLKSRGFENISDFKLNEAEIEDFTRKYNEFRRENKFKIVDDTRVDNSLKAFLEGKGAEFQTLAKDIFAYHTLLIEDGNNFYQMVIKKMDRDSVKYNNRAQIGSSQKVENALVNSKMLNSDFVKKLKTESVFAPFYNDEVVIKVLRNVMPELFDSSIPNWDESLTNMIYNIVSEVNGNSETNRKIEGRILSDLVEFIYKNFYVFKWSVDKVDENGNVTKELIYNTLYEAFERSIIPELSLNQIRTKVFDEKGKMNTNINDVKSGINYMGGNEELQFLSGVSFFANQIDFIKAKYPELNVLKLVEFLQPRRLAPRPEYEAPVVTESDYEYESSSKSLEDEVFGSIESNFKNKKNERTITVSEVFNNLSQSFLTLGLNTDPQAKINQEKIIRDEFEKLTNFNIYDFPDVLSEALNDGRIEVYTDANNISELRQFFTLLAYYSLVQNSPLDKAQGALSYLAPVDIIQKVVGESLKNFKTQAKQWSANDIATFLSTFENAFREMNPDIGLSIPNNGVAYKRDKVKSGKPYSKFDIPNNNINNAKNKILNNVPNKAKFGFVDFVIDNSKEESNILTNPLNCK